MTAECALMMTVFAERCTPAGLSTTPLLERKPGSFFEDLLLAVSECDCFLLQTSRFFSLADKARRLTRKIGDEMLTAETSEIDKRVR